MGLVAARCLNPAGESIADSGESEGMIVCGDRMTINEGAGPQQFNLQ